ncbi:MAG: hypothetical protein AAGN35_06130 [Bacteroidota bacterium]
MPYTHFRYIAYQLPTIGGSPNPRRPGDPPADVPYQFRATPPGNLPVTQAALMAFLSRFPELDNDSQIRVGRFVKVLERAAVRLEHIGGDNDQTLKIFTAPEFYFRPPNAEFAYTYAQYRGIKAALRTYVDEHRDQFRHWLIFCGTIMWQGVFAPGWWDAITGAAKRRGNPHTEGFFNSCVYIYGGDPRPRQGSRVVEKANASNIDGLPGITDGAAPPPGVDRNAAGRLYHQRYQSPAKQQKHIFNIGGVNIGLDICLEHGAGLRVVRNAFLNTFFPRYVQLHVIVAGGMTIRETSVSAIQGGFVLRNDGINVRGLPVDNTRVECLSVSRYTDPPGTPAEPRFPQELDSTAHFAAAPIPIQDEVRFTPGALHWVPAPPGTNPEWDAHFQGLKFMRAEAIPDPPTI